jgi:hypothetical protein
MTLLLFFVIYYCSCVKYYSLSTIPSDDFKKKQL